MNSALYVGTIAHQRHIPIPHTFRYPFFMWYLNLDELDRLPPIGRWDMSVWSTTWLSVQRKAPRTALS